MRTCSRCKVAKPSEEFHRNASTKDGLQQFCKVCLSAYNKERYKRRGPTPPREDGEKRCSRCGETKPRVEFALNKANLDGRDWYCKPCKVIRSRERREADPARYRLDMRRARLRTNFKMTVADYESLLDRQGGGCAVCGVIPEPNRWLNVDHDHRCCPGSRSCGQCVRGLLCWRCNSTLGNLGEDVKILQGLIDYISRTQVG